MKLRLHPFQNRAVRRAMQVKRRGRLLMVGPTGCGKTVIAVEVIRRYLRQRKRVLFVAHTQPIVDQTYRHLINLGLRPAQVGVLMASDAEVSGHRERIRPDAPVQVCSVQTLARRNLPRADLVIIDEAHHSAADTYMRVVIAYPDDVVLGLTATPQRADGKGLRAHFGELFVIATPMELIAKRKLARPIVYSKPDGFRDGRVKRVKTIGGDYAKRELGEAMNHRRLVGNIITEWKRLGQGRRTVVFASSVEHSISIRNRFRAAGVKAEHIDQSTSPNDRAAILERLDSGETTVVCNYAVLGEGWDQPSVKCVVLARPTKSLTVYLQQAGRTMRIYRGQRPIVLDHAGNALRFGLPEMDREHSLDDVPKGRGAAPVKACPECYAVNLLAATECEECGHKFPAPPKSKEEIEAELQLLHDERVRRLLAKLKGER